jgi:hypothetical protein
MTDLTIGVGDVLTVRTGTGWAARLIDVGAALRGKPSNGNHVVVAHHQDPAGVWWGIEGKPGGVGWADLRRYLADGYTVSNAEQPRTDEQRAHIASLVESMLGTPYDWEAIAADAMRSLGIPALFAQNWHGQGAPGHVVCSSLAAHAHRTLGLAEPAGTDRLIIPGDWTAFSLNKQWA